MKKINLNLKKIDLTNKEDLIKIIVIALVELLLLIAFVIGFNNSKKLTCTLNNELIKGFKNKEQVVFVLDKGKIKNINYDRTISINDYYESYDTYINSLKNILNTGYKYVKKYEIKDTSDTININYKTKDSGVILNNLTIVYNSNSDDTSLRYDIINDVKNNKNAFKVGDEYSKAKLKKEVKNLGYKCK